LRTVDLALAWVNAVALYATVGAIGLAASVSFDRLGPAAGITLGFLLLSYTASFIGTLWPDAAWILPWSVFSYFVPTEVLSGQADLGDVAVLAAVFGVAVAYALWAFPRRDIAAPS
jgi:hypothetical protein